MLDIRQLLEQGNAALRIAEDTQEASKAGTLRVGNTGAMLPDGTVMGECARKAYLRSIGHGIPVEDEIQNMLDGGKTNEDIIVKILEASGFDGKILREEDVATRWETANGTAVTGRPDIVLATKDGILLRGIEAKQASSIWSATKYITGKPKLSHVLQAAHYSMELKIPFTLYYAGRTIFHTNKQFYLNKALAGHPLVEHRDGVPFAIKPFDYFYEIMWQPDGTLAVLDVQTGKTQRSAIKQDDIRRYFEAVANVEQSGTLPPRPSKLEFDGKKGTFNMCDSTYCPLADTCDRHEKNLLMWRDSAILTVNTLKGEKKHVKGE